jgi:hypothetical protein
MFPSNGPLGPPPRVWHLERSTVCLTRPGGAWLMMAQNECPQWICGERYDCRTMNMSPSSVDPSNTTTISASSD